MAHLYLAEALLYSDKISDSIENLTINTKIENDNDFSFIPTQLQYQQQNSTDPSQSQLMNENLNEEKIRNIKSNKFRKTEEIYFRIRYYLMNSK